MRFQEGDESLAIMQMVAALSVAQVEPGKLEVDLREPLPQQPVCWMRRQFQRELVAF